MDNATMQILNPIVTGGAGFIGSHLVEALVNSGVEKVTVIDDFSAGNNDNLFSVKKKVHFLQTDIASVDWMQLLSTSDYDYIFHFAGNANVQTSVQAPDFDYHLNLHATFLLLDSIRKVKWPGCIIFASSAAVYGNPYQLPISEVDLTFPISPYGVSKLTIERYLSVYSKLYNIKSASLRAASVYGPRLKKQVVFDTFQKLINNPSEIVISGDGTQTRDFVYVSDLANAVINIANRGQLNGEVYNVASGKSCSILELTYLISTSLKLTPKIRFDGQARSGDPDSWEFDISKLKGIGCIPNVPLQEGIISTKNWFISTYGNDKNA